MPLRDNINKRMDYSFLQYLVKYDKPTCGIFFLKLTIALYRYQA